MEYPYSVPPKRDHVGRIGIMEYWKTGFEGILKDHKGLLSILDPLFYYDLRNPHQFGQVDRTNIHPQQHPEESATGRAMPCIARSGFR
jgi:hypothetical protein